MKTLAALIILALSSSAVNAEIGVDKYMHVGVSTVIGGVTHHVVDNYLVSSAVCVGVGVAKEVYYEYDYGGFSKEDLVADVIGCAIGIAFDEYVIKPYVSNNSAGVSVNFKF